MTAEQAKMVFDFDADLKVGDEIEARWTNSFRLWSGKATIVKLNAKSIRVRLTDNVGDPRRHYPAGREITLPRISDLKRWSQNNGAFQL